MSNTISTRPPWRIRARPTRTLQKNSVQPTTCRNTSSFNSECAPRSRHNHPSGHSTRHTFTAYRGIGSDFPANSRRCSAAEHRHVHRRRPHRSDLIDSPAALRDSRCPPTGHPTVARAAWFTQRRRCAPDTCRRHAAVNGSTRTDTTRKIRPLGVPRNTPQAAASSATLIGHPVDERPHRRRGRRHPRLSAGDRSPRGLRARQPRRRHRHRVAVTSLWNHREIQLLQQRLDPLRLPDSLPITEQQRRPLPQRPRVIEIAPIA